MYIEDILGILTFRVQANPFDLNLITSFYDQICKGSGLTAKQSHIALKIINKYIDKINIAVGKDLTLAITNPTYRLGIRSIATTKNISIFTNKDSLKFVKVQFPYNEAMVTEIKKIKSTFIYNSWDAEDKAWIFSLEGKTIEFFGSWSTTYNFTVDEEFKNLVDQLPLVDINFESIIPHVAFDGENTKFNNVHSTVNQPTSNDIVKTLFEARRYGIQQWDDSIENILTDNHSTSIIQDYLKTTPDEPFSINLEEKSLLELIPIVNNLSPCIVAVPGGNEFSKTKTALELLKASGIENHEISVLFRLPSETGEEFNNFVKEEKLNSPISSTTKAIIVSGKIPKPVFESKLNFNCVINFNFYNVHYTLANFIKSQHNVINVLADKKSKGSQIGNM